MLKVGKRYKFRMLKDGEEESFVEVVERYEHPLLKLEDVDLSNNPFARPARPGAPPTPTRLPGKIINVTSPNFVSAVEDDRSS